MVSECAQTRRVLPTSPSLAGWLAPRLGAAEKEGQVPPALAAAQVEACLEGHAAATGSAGLLAISRMLCSVAV